ncbi:MAG: Vps51/Vps67-domain-containing protein [Olpidium bornovanus]|uniref:Exocyst complex component EXO84 n=1 Tax=Olpidium bornovanus TaxID=278681 RepID=A0A8H7ZVY7_9FUNG|nr:MAG: Vps51/Vps67-domain-containing protein [Olpidium bornovanus]
MSQGGPPALNIPPKSRHRKSPSDVAATLITKASNVIGSSSSNHQKGYSSSSSPSAQSPIPKSVSTSSGFGTSLPGLNSTPASSKWHPSAVDAKEALKKLGFEKTGFKFGKTHGVPQFDVRAFAEDSFAPEQFVFSILRDTNEEGVRSFHSSLQQAKEEAAEDLKRNVYRNYNEFVTISKEISKLETDMLVLRGLLSELRSVSDSLSEDAPQFAANVTESLPSLNVLAQQPTERTVPASGRRGGSGSDKELEGLWRAQVAALWNAVEGSQKYIPWVPGRHVIRENTNVLELNRSFKPRQAVHLFLLSDSLLVATRKKKAMAMSSKHKLIADKCWDLSEIAVLDIKDSPGECSNDTALSLRPDQCLQDYEASGRLHLQNGDARGKTGHNSGYQAGDRGAHGVTPQRTRVSGRVAGTFLTDGERDGARPFHTCTNVFYSVVSLRNQAPKSSMDTLGPLPSASETAQPPIHSSASRRLQPQQSRRELAPADIQRMNDLAEELDVFIAHREFEDAVEGLEKGQNWIGVPCEILACAVSGNLCALPGFSQPGRLPASAASSTKFGGAGFSVIPRDRLRLINTNPDKVAGSAEHNVAATISFWQQFALLNETPQLTPFISKARGIFLRARSSIIRNRSRQLKLEGEISNYITELSLVVFTLIKNTCDWYGSSFKEASMASGNACFGQLPFYFITLAKQTYSQYLAALLTAGVPQPSELRDNR